ncbi:hypothetical protein [Microvirga arsenatis]|uniref:DUF4352 domain-containing protein n=1 Tax=Microvirga arsenatis TaxID=2692265 RepID=A0ABW9YXL9_9HYPH|nr:hypothetical protein [Microvirga arsenatis]NBJ10640.1 hypothetical protein [Microvirga arsenatis]NBJ24461.1 hypothetical protein [Microvirga arsenatis]
MKLARSCWALAIGIAAVTSGAGLTFAQSQGVVASSTDATTNHGGGGVGVELAPRVRLEVVELRRLPDKGVMQLKFAVANQSGGDTSLKDHGLAFNHELRDIAVVDFAGRKKYGIGYAASCLCSTFKDRDGGVVRAGERREFWAWFAMPPAGVRQMAVQIPNQQPLMNIPLL